jgi:hypothetical protein
MAAAQKTTAAPLPAKLANLLREARWLVLAAAAGYLSLIFLTFHTGDPGWSLSATAAETHNAGGRAGAWVANLLLYLFGFSAYWWIALCLVAVAWGYRSLDRWPLRWADSQCCCCPAPRSRRCACTRSRRSCRSLPAGCSAR